MILIYSNDNDQTTNIVTDWLRHLGHEFIRLNNLNFGNEFALNMRLSDKGFVFALKVNGKTVNLDDIGVVWFRRIRLGTSIDLSAIHDQQTTTQIGKNLLKEKESIWNLLNKKLSDKNWLNKVESVRLSKLQQLEAATNVGLLVPDTLITTQKEELTVFFSKHTALIVKPIESVLSIMYDGASYTPFTKKVTENFINDLDDIFFPLLVQVCVEKAFEVRTFYLDGEFYSMAIFSQTSDKTKIDFRSYDDENPNRRIPFKLPVAIEKKLILFMDKINMNCGSFDIVVTPDYEFIFLEVNPVGQFGMVSFPCNYFLEKKVADYLIKKDKI